MNAPLVTHGLLLGPSAADQKLNPPTCPRAVECFFHAGHNVGLPHSGKLVCDGSKCWREEYGDLSDPMGWGRPANMDKDILCYNAAQVRVMGRH